jgi:hypothetical protein
LVSKAQEKGIPVYVLQADEDARRMKSSVSAIDYGGFVDLVVADIVATWIEDTFWGKSEKIYLPLFWSEDMSFTGTIRYFEFCGEVNTEDVLHVVKDCCDRSKISTVVIASETGRSAIKAVDILGSKIDVVVTHYPAKTWGPRGDIPIGLMREEYKKFREWLKKHGVRIVQGTRPFAPPSRSIEWEYPTPEGIIDKTLEVFGAGTKIAIEAALMATDAGVIAEHEEVISCAGTFKGLDTALLVRSTYAMNFFRDFEVKEILARSCCRVKKLPEYDYENWKGDLDCYYGE